jgi:putative oxidoreductase
MKIVKKCCHTAHATLAAIPLSIPLLLARFAVFTVFWRSVQTKISGLTVAGQDFAFWNVTANAKMLFQYEYNLPLLPPIWAAYLGTWAEFFFALMLLLGIATRLGALGLIAVTAVIQFMVYPGAWPTHLMWFALLLFLLRDGGGKLSIDYLLQRVRQL